MKHPLDFEVAIWRALEMLTDPDFSAEYGPAVAESRWVLEAVATLDDALDGRFVEHLNAVEGE